MKILTTARLPRAANLLRPRSLPPRCSLTPLPPTPDPIPRLELYNLHSAILPDDRTVYVYLPSSYAEAHDRRYPVFYLHDGQNLFDPRGSYVTGHTWRAGETADRLAGEGKAEEMILVGVANAGFRRMAEYTPTRSFRMGGGEGADYGLLLTKELKPFIDRTYRTLPTRANTGLGGSSLGGLISLYLGLMHPDTFGKLAVVSPSIWWDHRSILPFVQQANLQPPPRIWLDIGTGEGARHVRDTEQLYRMLAARGWTTHGDPKRVDLKLDVVPDAVHNEDAWAARFDQVLEFLFPPATPS